MTTKTVEQYTYDEFIGEYCNQCKFVGRCFLRFRDVSACKSLVQCGVWERDYKGETLTPPDRKSCGE